MYTFIWPTETTQAQAKLKVPGEIVAYKPWNQADDNEKHFSFPLPKNHFISHDLMNAPELIHKVMGGHTYT